MDMSTDVLEAVRQLRRSLSRAAAASFAATGVGSRQGVVMHELGRAGSVAQVELARATATDPAAMMRAIDALERRGWVQRSGCEGDRRRKLVSLTADGRRALVQLDQAMDSLRTLVNEALPDPDRERFCALAANLTARLNEAGAAVPLRPEES